MESSFVGFVWFFITNLNIEMFGYNDIKGLYVNLYENGDMWTPPHGHHSTNQMVISLGETRTFTIDKDRYELNNGDVIIFGDQLHGIPKHKTTNMRISIATFS